MGQAICPAIRGHPEAADSPVPQAGLPERGVASTASLPLPGRSSARLPAIEGMTAWPAAQPSARGPRERALMLGLVLGVKSPAGLEGTQGERPSGPPAWAGTQ